MGGLLCEVDGCDKKAAKILVLEAGNVPMCLFHYEYFFSDEALGVEIKFKGTPQLAWGN